MGIRGPDFEDKRVYPNKHDKPKLVPEQYVTLSRFVPPQDFPHFAVC